jgi:hypothetical protein
MNRHKIARLAGLLAAALVAASCSDSVNPGASNVRAAGAAAVDRLAGAGRIEPGGVIITFDFDVQSDLTGRFTASDSSDVRPDGTVGTLRVDASDPQTHFNAFRTTSSACSDPTRGAEFDGTGREDTGGLVDFNVVACDNGPAGSGMDFFRIAIPIENYDRSGPVTRGDVVRSTATSTGGTLTASTSTSGSNLDPDGYTVTLDGTSSQAIAIDGTVTFSGLAAGDHTVVLSGVADNCAVDGGTSRTATVPADGTANVAFSVTCTGGTGGVGDLVVTTSTSGSDLPSGYTVTVDGSQSQSIAANGSVTFSGLPAGSHDVQLSGDASNCSVESANPQTVTVPEGGTATATFNVSCVAPNQPPEVNAGPNETVLLGLFYTEHATFGDLDNDAPWSYRIDWGDGSSPTTGSTWSQGTINAGHTYLLPLGTHTIWVTVVDSHGASGSSSKVVTVIL